MFTKRFFTSYKEVARIAADVTRYAYEGQSLLPITDYCRANGINLHSDARKAEAVCKIARTLGFDVIYRNGIWYERKSRIFI